MRLLRMRTCVVATDLDTSSDAALESAARLAAATGAAVHVIHVVAAPDAELTRTGRSERHEQDVQRALQRAGLDRDDVRVHLIPGDPRTTIGPLASSLGADVIVMGRRGPRTAAHRAAVGGTASAVVRDTVVPCLVVTAPLELPLDRVLIAMDRSDTARGALVVALSWASAMRPRGGGEPTVTALHVEADAFEPPGDQAIIDRELEALRRLGGDWAGVTVDGVTIGDADPVEAITRYAADLSPGLVVLGTRAVGRPTHPALGSVASALTARLVTPVLLVPPAVWRAFSQDLVA